MLEVLAAVSADLTRRGVAHALIGAAAMAARGVIRSTDDLDLLVTDRAVLRVESWGELEREGFAVEVRVGDDADPLAGVVRVARAPARAVDVVVGRHAWQADILRRAEARRIGAVEVGLVATSDLVLLKLFAGGSQDLRDVESLLGIGDERAVMEAVDLGVERLPADAREAWRALVRDRAPAR
jgi:predicted nucleotidyltransferase